MTLLVVVVLTVGLCLDYLLEWDCRQLHLVLVPRMELLLRSYRLQVVGMLLGVQVLVEVVRVCMEHQHLVVLLDIRLEGVTLRQQHHLPAVDTFLEELQGCPAVDLVLLLQLTEEVEDEALREVDLEEDSI